MNTNFTIMIVDDDPICATVMRTVLEQEHKVIVMKSGVQALGCMEKELLPDLVLLDMVMPGLSGIDVLKYMKTSERLKNVPVILVTGLEDPKVQNEGYSLGAENFIPKPVLVPVLKKTVGNYCRLIELERENARYRQQLDQLRELMSQAVLLTE